MGEFVKSTQLVKGSVVKYNNTIYIVKELWLSKDWNDYIITTCDTKFFVNNLQPVLLTKKIKEACKCSSFKEKYVHELQVYLYVTYSTRIRFNLLRDYKY